MPLCLEKKSTDNIVGDYYNLVIKLAKPYKNLNSYEDLLHEGVLGLLHAISFYDEELGKFPSYARQCIKFSIYSFLRKNSFPVHVPVKKIIQSNKAKKIANEQEILGLPQDRTEILSIMIENGDFEIEQECSTRENLEQQQLLSLVKEELLKFEKKDQMIIFFRYEQDLSFNQIGLKIGLSKEAVRKRHSKCISMIKKSISTKEK